MSHPLEEKLAALRSRIRRLVTVRGFSAAAAAAIAVVAVLGLLDYFIRFEDRGLRVLSWLAAVVTVGWVVYRCLYVPLVVRLRDVELARRVQREFPDLDDRLASAVEFLRQPEEDPTAGSAALRRTVIAQATAQAEELDFAQALDPRRPMRALIVVIGLCLAAGIVVVLDPLAARIALARLANPFDDLAWPQKTHLAIEPRVTRVARGQMFKTKVVDAGGAELPAELRFHWRFEGPDGTVTEETQRLLGGGDAVDVQRDGIARPFSYRVEGGDDHSMPWIAVEVLEPPEIAALAVELFPPPYTGWPPYKADKQIRALVGTRMRASGTATKPLQSTVLHLGGGRLVPCRVSDDGYRFSTGSLYDGEGPPRSAASSPAGGKEAEEPIELEKAGSDAYWFELTDREGLSDSQEERWELRVVPDSPPSVTMEQPAANVYVTPRAVVPLRISAKDDLAIRDVRLVFRRADQPEDQQSQLTLYAGPPQADRQAEVPLMTGAEPGDHRRVQQAWALEKLELAPGTQLTFHAVASDYQPASGASNPGRLFVITAEELQERIASRQEVILAELARVLKIQQETRAQVEALSVRMTETGSLGQRDVDQLQAAELNQRQVQQGLTGRADGVSSNVMGLLADLENNRIDNADVRRRMQGILDEIGRLDREHLPPIGRELTAAIKAAQVRLKSQSDGKGDKVALPSQPLAVAGQHQDHVIASLESLLGQLSQWDSYRRFHRELSQLLRDQEEINTRTAEIGRRTLTKSLRDLLPEESADLKILAGRQMEQARRLDRVQHQMRQAGSQLAENDPLASQTVADALDEALRLAISARMRSAAGNVQENQIGQALDRQKQVLENLQEVLDILSNRPEQELSRLVKKLQEVEQDLAALQGEETAARDDARRAAQESDRPMDALGRRQAELEDQAQRAARRLERLMAERAARAAQSAAGAMGRSAKAAGQNDAAETLKQADQALKELENAQRELAQRRLQAQAELAMEQLGRLEDALKNLHKQQQNALAETRRIQSLEQSQGRLTRAQAASLHDLAQQQKSLQEETTRLAGQLAGAAGFQLALSGAGSDMGRAAKLLAERQTGIPTQQAEQEALRRLDLILKALEPDAPEPKGGNGGNGPGGNKGQCGGVQTMAELKLLRLLQQDVNDRTRQLHQALAAQEDFNEDQHRQFKALAEEQGRLAQLVLQMLRPEPEPETP